jgi:hypothetical protein
MLSYRVDAHALLRHIILFNEMMLMKLRPLLSLNFYFCEGYFNSSELCISIFSK